MIAGWEWVIVLAIVILLFGIGRIGKLGSEMGKGIRAFREGLQDRQVANKEAEQNKAESETREA
jgi:sec-independent protein translocase protein TatA